MSRSIKARFRVPPKLLRKYTLRIFHEFDEIPVQVGDLIHRIIITESLKGLTKSLPKRFLMVSVFYRLRRKLWRAGLFS
jgi:hypothetical protein